MSVSTPLTPATTSTTTLVKMVNGEYAASSVNVDQKDAIKLDFVKENDGNYGTPPIPPSNAAAAQSSSTALT
jgi:hypothetical protein